MNPAALALLCDEAYKFVYPCLPPFGSQGYWPSWAVPYLRDAMMRAEGAAAQAAGTRDEVVAAQAAEVAAARPKSQGSSKAALDQAASTSDALSEVACGSIATGSASTASGASKRKSGEEPLSGKAQKVVRRSMPTIQNDGQSKQMVSRSATWVYLHSRTRLAVRQLRTRQAGHVRHAGLCPMRQVSRS